MNRFFVLGQAIVYTENGCWSMRTPKRHWREYRVIQVEDAAALLQSGFMEIDEKQVKILITRWSLAS